MVDYTEMKRRLGRPVNQTLDAPVMVLEFWQLSEVFVALGLILVFGALFYQWALLCVLLAVALGGLPYVRRNFNRGMVFHWPYSRAGMQLPGLANPGADRPMSD